MSNFPDRFDGFHTYTDVVEVKRIKGEVKKIYEHMEKIDELMNIGVMVISMQQIFLCIAIILLEQVQIILAQFL